MTTATATPAFVISRRPRLPPQRFSSDLEVPLPLHDVGRPPRYATATYPDYAPRALGDHPEEIVRRWVEMKFGSRVLELVEACTDADTRDAKGNKPPWIQRKIDYVSSIAQKSASALLVAAADKLHNARAILRDFQTHREELWGRFNKEAGKAGVIGYYRGLIIAFRKRLDALDDKRLIGLIDELDEVVTALEQQANHRGVWPPQPFAR